MMMQDVEESTYLRLKQDFKCTYKYFDDENL